MNRPCTWTRLEDIKAWGWYWQGLSTIPKDRIGVFNISDRDVDEEGDEGGEDA
jgi:hypothetical protein